MKTHALLKLADALESEHGTVIESIMYLISCPDICEGFNISSDDGPDIFDSRKPKIIATRIRKFVKGEL